MPSRTDDELEQVLRQRIWNRMGKLELGLTGLSEASGIELPTLQKMLDGSMGLGLKYLRPLAVGLRMPVGELFQDVPNLARSDEPVRIHDAASLKGWIRGEFLDLADRLLAQVVELVGSSGGSGASAADPLEGLRRVAETKGDYRLMPPGIENAAAEAAMRAYIAKRAELAATEAERVRLAKTTPAAPALGTSAAVQPTPGRKPRRSSGGE